MALLSPYTIISFWQKLSKSWFFPQKRHKNRDFVAPYILI